MEDQQRISDEDFINSYSQKNKYESRSDKYVKEKDSITAKGIMYWIFLAIVFIVAYYLFSTYFFPPQV